MNSIIEKKGDAIVCAFSEYPKNKDAWKAKHPNAKILEQYHTLQMGQVEIPDPQLIGRTKQVPALIMMWAVIFEEKADKEPLKLLTND
jgi:hypothetical protein